MNTLFKALFAVALASAASGCKSFLDVNVNPNQAVTETPDAILATALTTTAANYTGGPNAGQNYNSYGSFTADYWGKSGVISAFTEERTYNYSSIYYQNLFPQTYDNLNDYNIIQTSGTATGYPRHAAIARIMKVYNFLLLVDEYGDIPYTNALKGAANTTPSYDKAADIYKDFIVQLKGAVADINGASATARTVGAEDVVFQGNMTKWKQFANSLLLRVLLRESQTNDATLNASVATDIAALQSAPDGFITADVVVQPGYAANSNQQNPFYNRYGFSVGLTAAAPDYNYQLPTNYIIRQDTLVNKDPRISQQYRTGARPGYGKTTYVGTDAGDGINILFVAGTPLIGSRFLQGGAFLKGANAPTVIMLLAEHLFSKAECETRGLFTGGDAAAKADFLNGIKAAFMNTYRDATTVPVSLAASTAATAGVAQYNTYITTNAASPFVNYDLAPSAGRLGKQSVIIYQKYLAENTIASIEGWNDYRRTAYPKFDASRQSASPRPDKLAARLLYPQAELNTNAANVPTGVTQFTPIFWDVVD